MLDVVPGLWYVLRRVDAIPCPGIFGFHPWMNPCKAGLPAVLSLCCLRVSRTLHHSKRSGLGPVDAGVSFVAFLVTGPDYYALC